MKTRSNRSIVLLAVLVFLCQGFRASAKSAQERIGTFFYVVLTIKDGRLAVDWNKSYFTSGSGVSPKPAMAKPSFKCPPPISDENLKSLISDYVDRSLSRLPRLYWFGLTADQQKLDTTNSFDVTDLSKLDQAARDIRTYNAKGAPINWADFYQAFNAWAPNGSLLDDAFDNLFPRFIQNNLAPKGMVNISQSTPLTFDNSNGNAYFAPDGVIIFGVSEPVCNWSGNGYQVKLNGVLLANDKNTDGINGLLKSFKNRFWISADITALISDYFLSRGQGVQVRTSEPGAPKTIAIQQVRIAKVRFPYQSQDDDNAANEIMYLLLADPHFRAFLGPAVRGQVLGRQGDLPGFKVLDYCQDLKLCDGRQPLLNQSDLQIQELELKQLGFSLSQQWEVDNPKPPGEGGGFRYISLGVVKDQPASQANAGHGSVPKPAVIQAPDHGGVNAGNPVPDIIPSAPAPLAGSANTGSTPQAEKKAPNFLGGGFEYRPGQGVRPFVLAQRQGIFGNRDSISGQVGAFNQPFGNLSYSDDFILFNQLHRRLSLSITGNSDFEGNRLFGGVRTEERRSGGSLRAGLELFRDLDHQQLNVDVEAADNIVKLTPRFNGVKKQHLATLDLGAQYRYESQGLSHQSTVSIQPRIRFGLGTASDAPAFTSFRTIANVHSAIGGFWAADISPRFELDSRNTPIFEKASFGGTDTVRGFQRDDEIGRRLWSLQNELWIPLPRFNISPKFDELIRQGVRIAPFVDVGGIYGTVSNHDGVRAGAGAGLRYIRAPVVLKLDWAYGLGTVASGAGHGRVYFSVGTSLPF